MFKGFLVWDELLTSAFEKERKKRVDMTVMDMDLWVYGLELYCLKRSLAHHMPLYAFFMTQPYLLCRGWTIYFTYRLWGFAAAAAQTCCMLKLCGINCTSTSCVQRCDDISAVATEKLLNKYKEFCILNSVGCSPGLCVWIKRPYMHKCDSCTQPNGPNLTDVHAWCSLRQKFES